MLILYLRKIKKDKMYKADGQISESYLRCTSFGIRYSTTKPVNIKNTVVKQITVFRTVKRTSEDDYTLNITVVSLIPEKMGAS